MRSSGLVISSLWPLGLAVAVVLAAGTGEGQTEWTKYEGNPVVEHGAPGDWDEGVIDHSEVIFDGVTYHMWYAGGLALHETDIGYATSSDGVHWDKDAGNPVLLRGAPGEWDGGSLQPGAVIWDGALYHMWYGAGAVPGGAGAWSTGYATSPDGATWTKYAGNPVLTTVGLITAVLAESEGLRAWYWGGDGSTYTIGYATSPDGVSWTTWPEPVLAREAGWDRTGVAFPMVKFEGGAYHMWYTGGDCAGIGHAVSSDAINWVRQPEWEPVLYPGGSGDWDQGCIFSPRVVLAGDTAHMWYTAIGSVTAIGYATGPLPFRDDLESFIPAAAYAAGAEGAFFQTDVEINNTGPEEAQVAFQWLPRGEDNSEPIQSDPIALAPGESLRFENALEEVFGLEPNSLGALKMVDSNESVIGMSRTYNLEQGGSGGTFGQAMPAISERDMIPGPERRRILFATENEQYRTNVACQNGCSCENTLLLDLFTAEGEFLGRKLMSLGPWGNEQLNRVFEDYAPVNGYVVVRSVSQTGTFYCYGSVLDNVTSDPTTILPQAPSSETTFIPAVALSAGLAGSFFQTDLDLNNVGSSDLTYELLWLPRGADNSDPVSSGPFSLAAGASVRYTDVLAEVFGLEPDQVGALVIEASSSDLLAMSRTYNVLAEGNPLGYPPGATFGQELPGIPADRMIPSGVTKRIVFLSEDEDVRANLGCINGVGTEVAVEIELYGSDGAKLETKYMMLPPYSNRQINGTFQDYAPIDGYVDVRTYTPDASIYCYGSVLDNLTSDPTTVLPQ